MRTYYVYVDRTDGDTAFYVGKGQLYRLKSMKRNSKHAHVVKTHGFKRDVVFETNDEIAAFMCEQRLIVEHHTFINDPLSGPLACNFTLGGDGTTGHGPLRLDNPNYRKPKSATMRARLRQAKLGSGNAAFGKKQSDALIEKRIVKLRGRKRSLDIRKKISESLTRRSFRRKAHLWLTR